MNKCRDFHEEPTDLRSLMNSWRDQVHQWGYDQASGRKPPALKMEKERQPKNGETTNKPVIQLSKSIQDVQQAAL